MRRLCSGGSIDARVDYDLSTFKIQDFHFTFKRFELEKFLKEKGGELDEYAHVILGAFDDLIKPLPLNNKTRGRKLWHSTSPCEDIPGWNYNGYLCAEFAKYDQCGGQEAANFKDAQGRSPLDACCACGGGQPAGTSTTPTPPPTTGKDPDFKAIEDQVLSAPTNGVEVVIYIEKANIKWENEIKIENGQNVRLVGKIPFSDEKPILDGEQKTRHIFVLEGGTFSAENLVFYHGRAYANGDVSTGKWRLSFSMGVIPFLRKCTFRENEATSGGGAIMVWQPTSRIDEVSDCTFERNGAR